MAQDYFKYFGLKIPIKSSDQGIQVSRRPGGWVILERKNQDGSIQKFRMMWHSKQNQISLSVKGHLLKGEWIQDRAFLKGGASKGASTEADLIAQFPGKVRKILVKQGQGVEEGSPLLLVEAMKMEFAVKAPYRAKIKQILVKENQQLSPGDRFLDLEDWPDAK